MAMGCVRVGVPAHWQPSTRIVCWLLVRAIEANDAESVRTLMEKRAVSDKALRAGWVTLLDCNERKSVSRRTVDAFVQHQRHLKFFRPRDGAACSAYALFPNEDLFMRGMRVSIDDNAVFLSGAPNYVGSWLLCVAGDVCLLWFAQLVAQQPKSAMDQLARSALVKEALELMFAADDGDAFRCLVRCFCWDGRFSVKEFMDAQDGFEALALRCMDQRKMRILRVLMDHRHACPLDATQQRCLVERASYLENAKVLCLVLETYPNMWLLTPQVLKMLVKHVREHGYPNDDGAVDLLLQYAYNM